MKTKIKKSSSKRATNVRSYCITMTVAQREIVERAVNHVLDEEYNGDKTKRGRALELICASFLSGVDAGEYS